MKKELYEKIAFRLLPNPTRDTDMCEFLKEVKEELVDAPTEEEIKKEWENEDFEIVSFTKERIEIYKQWIERINHCSHHTFAEICIEKDFFYITGQFSNKYTQLLIKTFKWLGWYDVN